MNYKTSSNVKLDIKYNSTLNNTKYFLLILFTIFTYLLFLRIRLILYLSDIKGLIPGMTSYFLVCEAGN
jgi:hypothetical protein